MNQELHAKLDAFIEKISKSPDAREAFLDNPMKVIRNSLQLNLTDDIHSLSLANSLLLSILKSPQAASDLTAISVLHASNLIDIEETRRLTAKAIWNSSSEDVKAKILEHKSDGLTLTIEPNYIGMANVAVAVDTVAVATEAVVVNSEYVFSGSVRGRNITDIQKIISAITGGN